MDFKILFRWGVGIGGAVVSMMAGAGENHRAIPPAYGPHIHLSAADFAGATSFGSTQRIVGTYYFYWYDGPSKLHMVNGDGSDALTTHPANMKDFSFKSVSWHKRQLRDMMEAGIDCLLPVFWGAPSEQDSKSGLHWSYEGIPPLIAAREELLKEGKQPPRIGMFYDTSTLQYNHWGEHLDLTTDYGKEWFYATVRDFFSMAPAKHWAMIDGKPIVLLYSAAFVKKHDQGCVQYLKEQFAKDFGGRVPYLAREISWQVKSDNTVAWGGALGLKNPGIGSVGPGYDHSAVPGRTPLIVDRRDGKFYEENWIKFLRKPSNFVMLETWDEFHEGTDIAESKEYGRKFIELTGKYAALFKKGWKPAWPTGKYSSAKSVTAILAQKNNEEGLCQVENDDGMTEVVKAGHRDARKATSSKRGKYIYLKIDDSFKTSDPMNLRAEVEYFDAGSGRLGFEFDGSDPNAPFSGAYTSSPERVELKGDGAWKKAVFTLKDARLLGSQNRGADCRLVIEAPELSVAKVRLTRSN